MDRSAEDFARSIQGEQAAIADRLRREAVEHRRKAADLEAKAIWHDERGAWAGEFAEALCAR